MPKLITAPARLPAMIPKANSINDYIARTQETVPHMNFARRHRPGGWAEPGQIPESDEYTMVLRGMLRVVYHGGVIDVVAGNAVVARRGEWVQYSTPHPEGAEYIAISLPENAAECPAAR